jgi:hypothetical protein
VQMNAIVDIVYLVLAALMWAVVWTLPEDLS